MRARLLALGAVILARLGFLGHPALAAVPCLRLPVPAPCPAPADPPRLSLGLPGHWTPMTGSWP
jgi:hypothetical protein